MALPKSVSSREMIATSPRDAPQSSAREVNRRTKGDTNSIKGIIICGITHMELHVRALPKYILWIFSRTSRTAQGECLEAACMVGHMKQRVLPAFGHTILRGRSNGQKDSVSLCTQEVSLYLFSRPEYTCICRWLTSSRAAYC